MVAPSELALDSNIAIDLLNQRESTLIALQMVETFYLPVTVCGELLFGAKNSIRSKENEPKYWALIDRCEIISLNLLVAEEYALIRKELKDKGRPISENDIWIAASCRVNQLTLATRDKHFNHINGLMIFGLE